MALLEIEDLKVQFQTQRGVVRAVDGFSCRIDEGETIAIVGESGCGKSAMAMSVLGLHPRSSTAISGRMRFGDVDLLRLKEAELRRVRGNAISMIFQEPMSSLNPVLTIGWQISEMLRVHGRMSGQEAMKRSVGLLEDVGISEPQRRLTSYPHELSGGMRQRVMIAIALACDPKLLIADEPTTALDVTIQAQILSLLADIGRRKRTGIMLITHDLGVVAQTAKRVIVMYAGRKVEEAPVHDLFGRPLHPYTQGLLGAVPRLRSSAWSARRLTEIPGMVPSPSEPIIGCAFAGRCTFADDGCRVNTPELELKSGESLVACHKVPVTIEGRIQ